MNMSNFVFIDSAAYEDFFEVIPLVHKTTSGTINTPHTHGEFIPMIYISPDGDRWYEYGSIGINGVSVSVRMTNVSIYSSGEVYVRVLGIKI